MSTDNVVHLPDTRPYQWRLFETMLRHELATISIDSAVSDIALENIKQIYQRHAKPNEMPDASSPEELLRTFNTWVTRLGCGLLIEILIREVELINLRGE